MWPFRKRPRHRRKYRQNHYLSDRQNNRHTTRQSTRHTARQATTLMLRKWLKLFAFALSCALFFQACGGSAELGSSDVSTGGSTLENTSEAVDANGKGDNSVDKIATEHSGDKPTPTPIAVAEPAVPVTGEAVTYATVAGEAVTGYLAQPEAAAANLPAVIAIHEWWGLNENIEAMARRIAGEGYTVLAVDLYGNEIATEPAAAKDLLRSVMDNPGPAQDNLAQAAQFLKEEYGAPKLGVMGWCFGGNWSLRTGLLLKELDALVIYYGQLILAPEALDGLEAPILGFFGEEDTSIPVEDVENFEEILTGLGKSVEINLYPGVGHAFANPSGQNYDATAAEDAWDKTTAFFTAQLGGNETQPAE
ncbi:MAG: dienelactone hydrolase family protein [Phormidesmis sp.]